MISNANPEPRLLIAEDEERLRRLLEMLLGNKGYSLTLAADGEQAWQHFQSSNYDLVITDLRMPNMDGMQLLQNIKNTKASTPVIVITAFGTIENAVEAMQAGALDYVTKPFEEARLNMAIERALSFGRILDENQQLRQEIRNRFHLGDMIAESPAMRKVIDNATAVANSNANVIVYGESGTGKELITRYIHDCSPRSHKPLVALNCAAIPENLLESELFGHERGSFTGATDRKIGKFEQADGGSLFLDEIGEMNLQLQSKVLRAIEQQEFQRVGGNKTIRTNVRFIAATNRDLKKAVQEGSFRGDLYFRINVFPITIPPLRNRVEDVIPLAKFFLNKFCVEMGRRVARLNREAEKALIEFPWPGNVRELQNAIERAVILQRGDVLCAADLSLGQHFAASDFGVNSGDSSFEFEIPRSGFKLEEHERMLLLQALERAGNVKSRAAKVLGISRATLRYRLEKFNIGEDDTADLPGNEADNKLQTVS